MKKPKVNFKSIVILFLLLSFHQSISQQNYQKVRLTKLVIDSTQLQEYNALLKEEIEASVLKEPGVRTLYAVSEKENPNHITILEIYASQEAYQAHLLTKHFLKYKNGTKEMVQFLELIEVDPLISEMKIK